MNLTPDPIKGLYPKYAVTRTDGSSERGGKHYGCTYFVLDITHDPNAIPALIAYAESCRWNYPELASDIDQIVDLEMPELRSAKAKQIMYGNKLMAEDGKKKS